MPKRCGHFADKRVIPSEEMVLKIKAAVKAKERSGLRHFRPDRRAPDERPRRRHRSSQSMLRQWRGHRLHRSARIACRTGGYREAGQASAVRQYAYRRGDADSLGKGAGATRLQDRGLPHRIVDGLRPGFFEVAGCDVDDRLLLVCICRCISPTQARQGRVFRNRFFGNSW